VLFVPPPPFHVCAVMSNRFFLNSPAVFALNPPQMCFALFAPTPQALCVDPHIPPRDKRSCGTPRFKALAPFLKTPKGGVLTQGGHNPHGKKNPLERVPQREPQKCGTPNPGGKSPESEKETLFRSRWAQVRNGPQISSQEGQGAPQGHLMVVPHPFKIREPQPLRPSLENHNSPQAPLENSSAPNTTSWYLLKNLWPIKSTLSNRLILSYFLSSCIRFLL